MKKLDILIILKIYILCYGYLTMDRLKGLLYSIGIFALLIFGIAFWYISLLVIVIVAIIYAGQLMTVIEKELKE